MWFGSVIYKKNSVESYTHHLADSSKQKLLFNMIEKSLDYIPKYKSFVELPRNSVKYMIEDDNSYHVYLKGSQEKILEKVLDFFEDHSSSFDGFEGSSLSFRVSFNTPYLLEIEHNKAFDDFNEHWLMEREVIQAESYSSLDILGRVHILNIVFGTSRQKYPSLEEAFYYAKDKYGGKNLDLNVRVIYYNNSSFETLKKYGG
jgi:hypothetical protein